MPKKFRHVRESVDSFEGTEQSVLKAKEAIPAKSHLKSLRDIDECCIQLGDEIQRADRTKYETA